MGIDAGRRAFLRGAKTVSSERRPPWSVTETAFVSVCDRCGLCARACPEAVIVAGDGGFPAVDFARRGCSFCGDCVQACPRGVLDKAGFAAGAAPWALRAAVGADCLLARGVECRVCGDHCAPGAIRFRPVVGGRVQLLLDQAACTGCGACVGPCPVRAVTVSVPVEG